MDFCKLGSSSYYPTEIIHGWESLIWTERFQTQGEFKLTTSTNIPEMMEALQFDFLVSLLDSRQVMVVEDHAIETDDAGLDHLTVSGRSIDKVLYERVSTDNVTIPTPNPWQITAPSAAAAVRNIINAHINDGIADSNDIWTNNNLTCFTYGPTVLEDKEYSISMGQLGDEVSKMMKDAHLGFMNQRQLPADVDNGIKIYIVTGEDRTADSTTATPVIFSAEDGHLLNPSYLKSIRNKRNVAYVFSPILTRVIMANAAYFDNDFQGKDRKVLYVDATDITEVKSGQSAFNMIKQRGRQELAKHKKTGVIACQISPNIPQVYNVDYKLGDWVTIKGKYNVVQDGQVTEFIRTQDASGEFGYPTVVTDQED